MVAKKAVVQAFEKRVFRESYYRIFKCLNCLNEDQIWQEINKEIPTIGSLILHLCGNARQWILSGIGGKSDNRLREQEFQIHKNIKKTDLIFLMENLRVNLRQVLEEMPSDKLNETLSIQGFEESGFSVIVHVIEHFSYHTGQITTLTKIFTKKDLGYYGDMDLNKTNH
ncbi:MAG: DinB family protein [Crocinitomicaceae bacterium]